MTVLLILAGMTAADVLIVALFAGAKKLNNDNPERIGS